MHLSGWSRVSPLALNPTCTRTMVPKGRGGDLHQTHLQMKELPPNGGNW